MNPFSRFFTPACTAGVLLTLLLCSGSAEPSGGSQNLLSNGDFSGGTTGWNLTSHAKQSTAEVDPNESRAGKPSVRIDNAGADDSQFSQKVTVKPMTRYRLTGWIKTDKIKPGPANPKSTAGASLTVTGTFQHSPAIDKAPSWKQATLEITTTDKQTELSIGPRLGAFGGTVIGKAWYSDLVLKEIGPARK